MKKMRIVGFLLALVAAVLTFFLSFPTMAAKTPILFEAIMNNYVTDTHAENAVASVYLHYRVFDTVFEALMLLVSVMGVVHFSRHEHDVQAVAFFGTATKKKRPISIIALILPIIMMLGFYLIVNGHNTPGGGFQGGAALSSVFICVYLVKPQKVIRLHAYERLEKLLFLALAMLALTFAASSLYLGHPEYNIAYLILMNGLIGIKVFCGLTLVFYRFVHYEDN